VTIREYHFVLGGDVEFICHFPLDFNKPPEPLIPHSLMFKAFYIADITDCPDVKVLKDKRRGTFVPLPFIAAPEVDREWLEQRGYIRSAISGLNNLDVNSLYPSMWFGGTSSGKSNLTKSLTVKVLKQRPQTKAVYMDYEGSMKVREPICPICEIAK